MSDLRLRQHCGCECHAKEPTFSHGTQGCSCVTCPKCGTTRLILAPGEQCWRCRNAYVDIRANFGTRIADSSGHDFSGPARRPARVTVGRTDGANPCVALSVTVIDRPTKDAALDWQEIALANLDPRAARHLAYAILLAANECEP